MKKILTALLVVLSIFALVSCSSSTSTTTVKLNLTNSYTATASLEKEPTTKCGLYYKTGSTYTPATDGVVPVLDSTGVKIGNAIVKYVADKLLGFTFVTGIEKSASGSAEVTVGVLTGTTMEAYGVYKVEVIYTYVAPPEPEPVPVYVDEIDLWAEPHDRGVAANVGTETVSFVASSDDVIAFVGSGLDLSKYEPLPFLDLKNTLSYQEWYFDDYNMLTVVIDKVGTASEAIFTYTCNYDKDPDGLAYYPMEKWFVSLKDAKKIVVAGYTKNAKGEIIVDEDKVHIWSDLTVLRTHAQAIVAQDGVAKDYEINAKKFNPDYVDSKKLGVYVAGEYQFSLAEAKEETQYVVTKSGNGFVTFKYEETTDNDPETGKLTLSFNGVASDKGVISDVQIATIGDAYAIKKLTAVFDVAYEFKVADPEAYAMTINPYMNDYELKVPVFAETAKLGEVSLVWWNDAKVDEPGWDFFNKPDTGDEYLGVVLKNKGYDDEVNAYVSYNKTSVDGKVVLTLSVAEWPWKNVNANNQARAAEKPLLVAIRDANNKVDRLVALTFVQNKLEITELTNSAATAGAAVALKAGLAAPDTSNVFTGPAMQVYSTTDKEWIDVDEYCVIKSTTAGSDNEASLNYANGILKLDLNSFGGADKFSTITFASYKVTTGAEDANGVYVPTTVYAAKEKTTPATNGVLSLSQNAITSWTGINVGAKVLADVTTSYTTSGLKEEKVLVAKYMKVTPAEGAKPATYAWINIGDGLDIGLTNADKEYRAAGAKLTFTNGAFATTTQKASFNLSIADTVDKTASGTIPEIIVGYYDADAKFVALNYTAEKKSAKVQEAFTASDIAMSFKSLTGKASAAYDKAYYEKDGKWVEFTSDSVIFYTEPDHTAEGAAVLAFVPNVYEGKTLKTQGYFEMTGLVGAIYTSGSKAKYSDIYLGKVDATTRVFTATKRCNVVATVAK